MRRLSYPRERQQEDFLKKYPLMTSGPWIKGAVRFPGAHDTAEKMSQATLSASLVLFNGEMQPVPPPPERCEVHQNTHFNKRGFRGLTIWTEGEVFEGIRGAHAVHGAAPRRLDFV